MPFYVGDYLRDTGRLTTENHGAYLLLIFDYWTSRAPLPDDDDQLAAIVRLPVARWQKARKVIVNYFTVADGVWRHKRIDAEIERANSISKARQEAGKRGGKAKAIATSELEQTPKQNPTPSPSPSHVPPLAIQEDSSPPPAGEVAKQKRKTRLDAEFVIEINSERYAYAKQCGMTEAIMEIECDKFENHHRAKGNLMADWDAAWRTWCRNWQSFSQQRARA